MPPRPLQTNFTAGEWSPKMEGRPDLAKYFNACKTLENLIVFRQGGVTRRPGTRFVTQAKIQTSSVLTTTQTPTANAIRDGGGWTNPTNAHAQDAVYATATPGGPLINIGTDYFTFNVDTAIPAGYGIVSVKVICRYKVSSAVSPAVFLRVTPILYGVITTPQWTDSTQPLSDTDITIDLTSIRVWERTDLLNANFKLIVEAVAGAASGPTFSLDVVKLIIEYMGPTAVIRKPRLIPFVVAQKTAYQLEFAHQVIRVFKNGALVYSDVTHNIPLEIVSPYLETDLPDLQVRKSVDVMYIVHPNYAPRKLSRVSDTNWTLSTVTFLPPPSVEANTDLAQLGAPNANSGNAKKFRAKGSPFLAGDKGRQLISGAGRAIITAVDSVDQISIDILNPFAATITAGPNTLTSLGTAVASTAHGAAVDNFVVLNGGAQAGEIRRIVSITDANNFVIDAAFSADQGVGVAWQKIIAFASGVWLLAGSPQTTLDPDIKEPIHAQVTLVAGAAAFRSADVGKFIKVYGGVIKLTIFDSTTQMRGEILGILSQSTTANPAAASAGSWTLEVEAWSTSRGFPACVEFDNSRLAFARTVAQPTTWWESAVDDYENIAVGALADDAIEYTIASRELNAINWLLSDVNLFIGTEGNEYLARGPGVDQPLGGDVIPYVPLQGTMGSQASQALSTSEGILFVDRSGLIVCHLVYNPEREKFVPIETTLLAEHITKPGLIQAPPVYQQKLDSLLWFARADGMGLSCTFYRLLEDVTAWGRQITDGSFESFAVIPHPNGDRDQLWAIVKRTINGVPKRYVEYFEDGATEFSTRAWDELYTDCAKVYSGGATTTITGLSHLEAKTVDVMADGSFVGTKIVSAGQITLDTAASKVEVGLHYDSTLVTMRPVIPGVNIEGIPRRFTKLFVRLLNSIGGKINGELIQYPAAPLGTVALFTGDRDILNLGTDTEGRITITQEQPYPMTVLALFGELEVGSRG